MNPKHDEMDTGRRRFLAQGALLGGLFAGATEASAAETNKAVLNSKRPDAPYELGEGENVIHSCCLQCNTGCGIKCKLQDGVVTKIDGNPYNPWALFPHLNYATDYSSALAVDGSICPKGQAGLQTAYDPYRLRKVLKRAGKRGENKWVTDRPWYRHKREPSFADLLTTLRRASWREKIRTLPWPGRLVEKYLAPVIEFLSLADRSAVWAAFSWPFPPRMAPIG